MRVRGRVQGQAGVARVRRALCAGVVAVLRGGRLLCSGTCAQGPVLRVQNPPPAHRAGSSETKSSKHQAGAQVEPTRGKSPTPKTTWHRFIPSAPVCLIALTAPLPLPSLCPSHALKGAPLSSPLHPCALAHAPVPSCPLPIHIPCTEARPPCPLHSCLCPLLFPPASVRSLPIPCTQGQPNPLVHLSPTIHPLYHPLTCQSSPAPRDTPVHTRLALRPPLTSNPPSDPSQHTCLSPSCGLRATHRFSQHLCLCTPLHPQPNPTAKPTARTCPSQESRGAQAGSPSTHACEHTPPPAPPTAPRARPSAHPTCPSLGLAPH